MFTGFFAERVAACSCPTEIDQNGREIPRDDFVWASHVFTGKLISVSKLGSEVEPYIQKAVFRVDEIWKGERGSDGMISLYLAGGMCEPRFEVKKSYLIYAERSRLSRISQSENTIMLSPNFCLFTAPLKSAKKQIKALRRRKVDSP